MEKYKPYPNRELINDWESLLKKNREELIKLLDEWKTIKCENDEIRKRNYEEKSSQLTEISDFMKSVGIDVFKYKRKGFFTEKNGYQSWYKKNVSDVIEKKYPYFDSNIPVTHCVTKTVNGVELYNNQSPTNILELYDRITRQYDLKKKEIDSKNKLLIKSIEYAKENNIDIDDLDTQSIISAADEFAKEKYLQEELPNGTEVYLKHACSECSSYIMGERRCSCGNRRISIQVEGNIIDGFYYYPEPY